MWASICQIYAWYYLLYHLVPSYRIYNITRTKVPSSWWYRELTSLQLNLFILGNRFYALFLSVKTKKKGPLKDFVNPLFVNILSLFASTDWCEKEEESFCHLCFHWVVLYLGFLLSSTSSLDVNLANLSLSL